MAVTGIYQRNVCTTKDLGFGDEDERCSSQNNGQLDGYFLAARPPLVVSLTIRGPSGEFPMTVIVTYGFRNAMLPVITTLSMVFSFLLGANVLVEKVFAWPGIGSYAVEALISSDFAPVQGFVLTMAVMYVLLNLVIDILYGVIDPRVRLEG